MFWPQVKGFLVSTEVRLRYAAMAVLEQQYCTLDFIRSEAMRMTMDTDRHIKDRAYRILDRLPALDGSRFD
ncbi:hypothetical protein A9Z06_13485 [Rhizobium sp. YK2]|nr:hypothetical protein A9Z06_13485 [Rhizobium sp. YK2]